MSNDEQAVRALFDDWIKATVEGDLELARRCIADDAVFLVPGVGEMDKEALKGVEVFGDHGYLWVESRLVCTPKAGGEATTMAGHSLSVLHKRAGRWLIYRDANTLTVVQE